MAMWVFGYGSLIWNPGFAYDARLVGFVRDYRRVFYQGSTDHRGTPAFPGRTVTLEHLPGATCWGVAYKISREQDKQIALEYLEVREKQYDEKIYLDLYTDSLPKTPDVKNVMVYFATANKETNKNYLGPAPLEEMAKQIYLAEGPSGPNKEYLFKLEDALNKIGAANCDETCDNPRIYISNLPPDVTVEELQELFGGIGQVGRIKQKRGYKDQWPWNIKIYTDESGNNKGDACLAYEDPSAAHAAGGFYNNFDMRGYKISVVMAEKLAPRAPTYGHGGGRGGGYGGDRRRDSFRDGGGHGPNRHQGGGSRSRPY